MRARAAALARVGNPDVTVRVRPRCGHELGRRRRLVGDDWAWPDRLWLWAGTSPGLVEEIAGRVRARSQAGIPNPSKLR